MDGGADDLVVDQATQPPYSLVEEGRKLAGSGTACLRPYLAQSGGFRIESKAGSRMNRLYILLTVMIVMVGALLATHEALAKVLTGTAGDDTLVGTDGKDRLKGRAGRIASRVAGGPTTSRAASGPTASKATAATTACGVAAVTTRSSPAKATTRCTPAPAPTVSTRATQAPWIT